MLGRTQQRATEQIAARNAAGLLYGMIITAAVLSAAVGHMSGPGRLVALAMFVLGIYWLADVYVRAFAYHFTRSRVSLWRRLTSAARHESTVLLGGVPAVLCVVLATLLGVDLGVAVDLALWLTVAELGLIAFLAARRVGAARRTALGEAVLAGLLGVAMIVAKALLH